MEVCRNARVMTLPVAIGTPALSQQERLSTAGCAGQGCAERAQCRRYRVIVPKSAQSRDFAHRDTLGVWMSFDIERQRAGDCHAFVRYREAA